jgi:6-methylsalicylate decarboxylase
MQYIDVHHHILPAEYVDAVGRETVAAQGSSGRVPAWSVQDALERMDAAGIQTAITSISAPGLVSLAPDLERRTARSCNEFAAGMMRDHPGRFGLFSTLPMHNIDATLTEATYAFDQFSADGVCMLSNAGGRYPGDVFFHPLYEELDRRHAVVFVHPTAASSIVPMQDLSPSMIEFPFDTARAACSLIIGGVTQSYPNIRWILSHAGGALPYLCGRLDTLITNNPRLHQKVPHGFRAELSKFYFDTALSANPITIAALCELSSTSRLLFGTDYPYGPKAQVADAVLSVEAIDWKEGEMVGVQNKNALALFPRFA